MRPGLRTGIVSLVYILLYRQVSEACLLYIPMITGGPDQSLKASGSSFVQRVRDGLLPCHAAARCPGRRERFVSQCLACGSRFAVVFLAVYRMNWGANLLP